MQVYLRNPQTGEMKKAKRGFSWTCLFFGFWPALFRGDWKWAGIGALFAILGLFTLGLVSLSYAIVAGFKYNEWYLSGLYDRGFVEISGVSPQAIEAVTSMPVVHPDRAEVEVRS
jgi:hypothetical protein